MYIAMVLGTSGYNYFNLFLKSIKNSDGSARWTTVQVNLIPIGGSAINVVFGTLLHLLQHFGEANSFQFGSGPSCPIS